MKTKMAKTWEIVFSVTLSVFIFLTCFLAGGGQSQAFTYVKSWGSQPLVDGNINLVAGVAVDATGNVYVSDGDDNRIQKFNSSGTFLAKWGSYGTGDSQFKYPAGMAVFTSGNVIVADYGNNRLQAFNSDGTTYVGQMGSFGSGNGQFNGPRGIAIDGSGNFYVVDSNNNRIQKFNSSGTFLAKWGSYGTGDGYFSSPWGVAVDATGSYVYVADTNNNRIQKFDSSGVHISTWSSFNTTDSFSTPRSVSVDSSGNVYVSDYGNNRILKFNSSGTWIATYGTGGFLPQGSGYFSNPQGLAVDGSGYVYAGDINNHRVQKFDSGGTFGTQLGGTFASGNGLLNFPKAIARDNSSGNFYVADRLNHRVQVFDSSGNYVTQWGSFGNGDGQFKNPQGIAVDGAGYVYVSDTNNDRIQIFDSSGTFKIKWNSAGTLSRPQGMAVDGSGYAYVADTNNHRIKIFTYNSGPNTVTYKTQWGSSGTGDGNFNAPGNIVKDGSGNIYVADTGNSRIQVFTYSPPTTVTYQTQWGSSGNGDGQFNSPWGIAPDGSGNVYVTDTNNHSIQKFSAAGTFILRDTNWGMGDGQFFYPYGLVVDGSGNVFVADSFNSRIQELNPSAISGRVTSNGTTGIASVGVSYCNSSGYCYGSTNTDSNGYYTLDVPAGSWKVSFNPPQGSYYLQKWYDNKSSSTTADSVTVTAGSTTTGIDAQLVQGGAISGKVTSNGTTGIASVYVGACDTSGNCSNGYGTLTDSNGDYTLKTSAGDWKIHFTPPAGYYLSQWYNGQISSTTATPVTVTAGATNSGKDAILATGGAISGKVTSDGTTGIASVYVSACDTSGDCSYGYGTSTDSNGDYSFNAPAGDWKIHFTPPGPYVSQWYDGQISSTTASPVTVTAEATTPNINAQLFILPTVTTNAASDITAYGATLNGTVNANNSSTTVTFQYGLTNTYGTTVTATPSPVTGTSDTAVSTAITGLTPSTIYHFRVVGVKNTAWTTNGGDLTFTTSEFGTGGNVLTPIGGASDVIQALGIQSDGKIVAAGYTDVCSQAWNTAKCYAFVRYNTDGELDSSFGSGGKTVVGFGYDAAGRAMVIQPDGKIVAAGSAEQRSVGYDFGLMRLTTGGSLDGTFNGSGKVRTNIGSGYMESASASSLALQGDGKIISGGGGTVGGTGHFALTRHNPDSSLDTDFGSGGIVLTTIGDGGSYSGLAVQSDGKIVAAGTYSHDGRSDIAVVRYGTDGSLDTTFNTTGIVTTITADSSVATSVAIQGDGKIVVAGYTQVGSFYKVLLVRYSANGSLDTGFGTGGIVTTEIGGMNLLGFAMALQSNGKIVVAGGARNADHTLSDFAVFKYLSSGSLDPTFGTGGITSRSLSSGFDEAYAVALQGDLKIVAGGIASNGSNYDFAVARFLNSETTPGQFTFIDQTGVPLNTVITSNPITVSGINAAAVIHIVGGTYSINGGVYTSADGMVGNGNTITVQQTSSASYSTKTDATLTIGGVSDTFSVTTAALGDPDASGLIAWWKAENNAYDSVGGNNGTLLNGTTYAAGKVGQAFSFDGVDDYIDIANTSNLDFGTTNFTIDLYINLNDLSTDQTFIHKVVGTYPNDQAYFVEYEKENTLRLMVRQSDANQNDLIVATSLSTGQWYHVAAVRSGNTNRLYLNGTLIGEQTNGTNVDTGSGGNFRIGQLANNGAPRYVNGEVDEIKIFNRALSALEVSTLAGTYPNAFSFTPQTGVALSTPVESNTITVTGITNPAAISITGGEYSVSTDSGTNWSTYSSSSPATVSLSDQVKVRQTSSASYSTQTDATLTIGGVSGTFSVTTLDDTIPDPFTFVDRTGVALNSLITSNIITVSGITASVNISITGNDGKYSVSTDGGSNWSAYSSSTPATVSVNNKVKVQQTSSASYSTQTDATLTIGGVSDTFSVTTQAAPVGNTWTQKADFGGSTRGYAVGFSIGSKGYIGTGWDGGAGLKDLWEYDPTGNSWTQRQDFGGEARGYAVGFSIGSKGYIGTGSYITNKKDFWEYDPAAGTDGTWTQKLDFGETERYLAVGFSIGDKGYIGTGYMGYPPLRKDFWEYDPAHNTWAQKTDFGGTERREAVGFSIGSKGYIGTGYDGSNKKDFWEYYPVTNTWTQKADFGGTERRDAVGFSIGSKGYIGTGYDGSNKKDFWEYDPIANIWMQRQDFGGTSRSGAVGFSIGNKVYIGTGYDGSGYKNDFWEYEPADTTPDPFTFTAQTGVALSTVITSNTITVSGIEAAAAISITGGEYAVSTDGSTWGSWTSSSGTVNLNNQVKARQTSSASYSTQTDATLTIGGVSGTFSVTTAAQDTTPDPFTFVDRTGVALSTVITSNTITVTGINSPAAISITGNDGKYSVSTDGGSHWSAYSSSTPTTVSVNDKVKVQQTSSASYSTKTDATLTIGGVSDTFSVTTQAAPVGNTWPQKADFGGTERVFAVGFSIGSKGYLGTGSYGSNRKDFWEYDPAGNLWSQKADFEGTARQGAVGFSIGSKGYIGTGFDGGYTKDFWEYDPDGNTWTKKVDFGGTARQDAVGFSIGSKGYIGTGADGIGLGVTEDFWEYDPAAGPNGTWTAKANFGGTARDRAVGFSIGSKGYIGTGFDGSPHRKDFWEYDPAVGTDGTWTQKADFGGIARRKAVGFSIGSKGYIGTGIGGSNTKDFWEYDPDGNTWTQRQDFGGTARQGAVGFSIGSKGYVGTGYDASGDTKDFWEYNPADTTPDQFAFTDQTGVALSTVITSNTITVSGIEAAAAISITGGEYSVSSDGGVNWGSWTSTAGTVSVNNQVKVRQTSSASYSTQTDATLTIGGISGTFSVTTLHDTTPDPFTFTAQTGVALSTVITSNTITVSGIDAAATISITGGEYAISTNGGVNWGSWTSTAGTVSVNNQVKVRQTSSASYSTQTDATLTIGGVSGTFSVTTLADTTPPTLNITSHTNGQHVTTSSITLSGTASDSGKGNNGIQQVTVNGVRANSDTATGSDTATWSKAITLNAGANALTVIAYDNSTNHNSTTVVLTIWYDSAQAPSVTTVPATNTTEHSATLNGTVNPNGLSTTYYFQWGPTTSYGNTTSSQSAGNGWDNVAVSANITGLTLHANYHFRLVATNSLGTTYGSDMSFIASVKAMPWLMLLLGN